MHSIQCDEIWGGIQETDVNAQTSSALISIYAQPYSASSGGDIYSISVCSSDMLTRIVIADVMGHGIAVSKTSEWLHKALQKYMNQAKANLVLTELNVTAADYGIKALTTAVIIDIYTHTGKVYYANAGHVPALYFHQQEKLWQALTIPDACNKKCNLPLAANNSTCYQLNEFKYQSGDKIFIYTDGLTEATSLEGEVFTLDKLLKVLNHTEGDFQSINKNIHLTLNSHCEGTELQDDISIICAQIK